MNPNAYPDGFPMTPSEAIEFSYFLTPDEKNEWHEWLLSATPEQQSELVSTLHEMWLENQKEAVPQGFNQAGPAAPSPMPQPNPFPPAQPQGNSAFQTPPQGQISPFPPAPNPFPNPTQPPAPFPAPAPFPRPTAPTPTPPPAANFNFDFDEPEENESDNTVPEPPSLPDFASPETQPTNPIQFGQQPDTHDTNQEFDQDDDQHDQLMSFGDAKYTPSAVLNNQMSTPAVDFNQAPPVPMPQSDPTASAPTPTPTDEDDELEENTPTPTAPAPTPAKTVNPSVDFAKVRSVATREMLEKLYDDFVQSREDSLAARDQEAQAQDVFLEKVAQILVNFEEVSDYFEHISAKLLEMNDKIVAQASDIQQQKNVVQMELDDLQQKFDSTQDQSDDMRAAVDRLSRDLRLLRVDVTKKHQDMTTQFTALGADTYKQDGWNEKLNLILARVQKLEALQNPPSPSSIRQRLQRLEGQEEDGSTPTIIG